MATGPHHSRQDSNIPSAATYLLALGVSFATTAVLLLISRFTTVDKTTIALIFLLPVGLSATLWGLIPGIVASVVSFLGLNYYFISPVGSLTVHNTQDLVILAAFLIVSAVISQLAGGTKRNLAAAQDREYEATQLYEFSALLAGSQHEQAIARILSDKIDQTLHPGRIEVLIEANPEPILLTKGISLPQDTPERPLVEPLQSARGLLGEIRLWRKQSSFSEAEQRLLKIFCSQGAMAIERLRLADAARKARLAEESDQLKSSLLSSVSHELRSPLAAVKASVSSLRSDAVEWETEARTELLATIEEEIDHLNMLVGNLLDMSRIEAGALAPQKKPNILAEIINAVRGRIRSPQHTLEIYVPDDLPLVSVDFVQMEQVFSNLLANSMKYSPPGSTIKVSARPKGKRSLQVTVTNQSTPVPEADLERMFDKFYRINPAGQVTGSGLGLSICKGIIEAHGGAIWAENLPTGLAFHFTLPINQ